MEKFFKLKQNNTTVRIEIIAGLTSFVASAFTILSLPGMIGGDEVTLVNAVFIAACIASAVGTLLMALVANLPFVQAPGMGLGSYFAFTVMPGLAVLVSAPDMPRIEQFQIALTLVFISGLIFLLFTFGGIREKIINGIPKNIKIALGSGIGLFITLLGLRQSGITQGSASTFVTLVNFGNFTTGDADQRRVILGAIISLVGVLVIAALYAKKVMGSFIIGIVVTTLLAYITGHTRIPENFSFNIGERFADFGSVAFFRLDFGSIFGYHGLAHIIGGLLAMVLAFTLVNTLDSLGTIFGVASAAGMTNEKGEVVNLKKGLFCDAAGTTVGALAGTSTVTTVVSSATGIGVGGRTGLTALVAGVLFIISLFLAPFISLIPVVGTAPALIFVGFLMMAQIREVDFKDPTEGFPAFLTVAIMPLTFSIANGIAFGLISYVILKLLTGKFKDISIVSVVISILFILQYIL